MEHCRQLGCLLRLNLRQVVLLADVFSKIEQPHGTVLEVFVQFVIASSDRSFGRLRHSSCLSL
jgi:hypothetical protein